MAYTQLHTAYNVYNFAPVAPVLSLEQQFTNLVKRGFVNEALQLCASNETCGLVTVPIDGVYITNHATPQQMAIIRQCLSQYCSLKGINFADAEREIFSNRRRR